MTKEKRFLLTNLNYNKKLTRGGTALGISGLITGGWLGGLLGGIGGAIGTSAAEFFFPEK